MKYHTLLLAAAITTLLLMSNVIVGDSSVSALDDTLSMVQQEKRELIRERANIGDSLDYYINNAKYLYTLKEGKKYELVHELPDSIHVWHYRIIKSVEHDMGYDTVFIGATSQKR